MKQMVLEFTRTNNRSCSIIDLVFSNVDECGVKIVEEFKISDHETIGILIPGTMGVNLPDTKKKYVSWKKYSRNMLQAILRSDVTLMTAGVSEEENATILSSSLARAVSELTEEQEKVSRGNTWFGTNLQAMKQQRDDAYKLYKRTHSDECWQQYKCLRNKYVRELRDARNSSVRKEIDMCSGDLKKLWKCLKSLISPGGEPKSSIVFEEENGPCTDEITAKRINEFFVNSVKEIHNSIPEPRITDMDQSNSFVNQFRVFQPISMQKLMEVVKGLKKCSGTDNITKEVLVDALDVVGDKLLDIINVSLQQGVFPRDWKKSTVIPIPKVPRSTRPEDHRPINIQYPCMKRF